MKKKTEKYNTKSETNIGSSRWVINEVVTLKKFHSSVFVTEHNVLRGRSSLHPFHIHQFALAPLVDSSVLKIAQENIQASSEKSKEYYFLTK